MDKIYAHQLILLLVVFSQADDISQLCEVANIAIPLCHRLFPERLLSPHDLSCSKQILNSSCYYNQIVDSITITSLSCNLTALNSDCDFIPSNTSHYNFGSSTNLIASLVVQNTNIKKLKKGIFATWYGIQKLEINMNNNLTAIEPGTFHNLTNVWNLTISDNPNLGPLEADTFRGLRGLRQLRYLRNNVIHLDSVTLALTQEIVPYLTVLDFTGNNINRVEKNDFKYMETASLNTLTLSLTKTQWIHEHAFDYLTTLVHLDLSRNNLNSTVVTRVINSMIGKGIKLTHLSLGECLVGTDFKLLLDAVAQNGSSIFFLDLDENHIGEIGPGFFPKMPNLQILDLRNVMIDKVPEGVISHEFMPQLEYLYLGGNIFSGLTPSMVTKSISRLYMSNNENDLPWATYFDINSNVFVKMPSLELLDLTGNKINILRRNTLMNTSALKVLLLRRTSLGEIEPGVFTSNKKLFYLDLSYNYFPVENPFKKEIFEGLDNLIALDLSSSQISYIEYHDVFVYLKKLQYLSLRMNSIYTIDPVTFSKMPLLQVIDLRYNIMVAWNKRIFESNKFLIHTLLDYNHIQTITEAMMKDFMDSKTVTMYRNLIMCDCRLMNAVRAVKNSSMSLDDLPFSDDMNTCINQNGTTVTNFLSLMYSSMCTNVDLVKKIIISVCILIFLSLGIYIVYYYYKYDIHFWYLRTKRKLGLLHYISSKNVKKPEDFQYDAFVSYCIEDEKFVEKMVYLLEGDGSKFKLCVFERDFKVGDVLADRILNCIENSRRTILVLTESFARSQWCCWEMYIAQSRSISLKSSDPNDPLILIKKSEISESLMTPTLRYLMSTRVYLQWHDSPVRQKIFWEKLKNSLKVK